MLIFVGGLVCGWWGCLVLGFGVIGCVGVVVCMFGLFSCGLVDMNYYIGLFGDWLF